MLTDAKVRTAKPRPKPYKIFDANRLYLLITPAGGKLWRWNYAYDGKNKTMVLGAYPNVSLADARPSATTPTPFCAKGAIRSSRRSSGSKRISRHRARPSNAWRANGTRT